MTTVGAFVILILCIVGTHCDECAERPPPAKHEDQCCKINRNNEQYQCIATKRDQWQLLRLSENKEDFAKTHDMCFSNCVFNNTDIITPDKKVNSDELKIVLGKAFGMEWQSQLTNMVEICKERVDNTKPNGANKLSTNCNIPAEKLFACLHEQVLNFCPDSLWNNTPECNNIRTFIKKCPYEKRGQFKPLVSK